LGGKREAVPVTGSDPGVDWSRRDVIIMGKREPEGAKGAEDSE
jgi:hypothetical protein